MITSDFIREWFDVLRGTFSFENKLCVNDSQKENWSGIHSCVVISFTNDSSKKNQLLWSYTFVMKDFVREWFSRECEPNNDVYDENWT